MDAAPTLRTAAQGPEAAAAAAAIRATASLPRAEAIIAIRAARTKAVAAVVERMMADVAQADGVGVCHQLTAITDAIVIALVERAFARAPANWRDQVGVLAVGGYGRAEMNPCSDVDLVVLCCEGREPAWLSTAWPELQAALWDVKFTVGAAKRSLGELARILGDDVVTATALLEQRPLIAGPGPAAAVEEMLAKFRRSHARSFLRDKIEELQKRRDQVGVSLFRMEPNLKSNPGCLRDVQLLRNIAHVVLGSRELGVLAGLESVPAGDLAEVERTNGYLLALRTALHGLHGRKQDTFSLADQVKLAKASGCTDLSSLRAVEHFMKAHYGRVLHVHQTLELVISRLRALGHLGRRLILIKTKRKLDQDFVVIEGQVYLAAKEFWERPGLCGRLLRMCRLAQGREARLSLDLQRLIKAHLGLITEEELRDPALGRVFLEIIGDCGRIYPILADMHNAGLLGAYLPEFGNLTCHMQFDSWHQYTVDQHTLLAMSYLDQVARGELEGLPRMRAIFPAIARKDLLSLGLLLHDMGKYMGRGHVARGAIMVAEVAARLGLSQDEEDQFYFLVERHVSLSDASRMRNFHEPSFLRGFTEKMVDQPSLDALYCLTFCDARAVGDGVLTGWQEAILGELHEAVSEQFSPDAGRHLNRHQRLVEELAKSGVGRAEAEAMLAEFPGTYLHQVRPGEIVRHRSVLERAKREGVAISHEITEAGILVAAAVPDRHGLFADVSATLSGHGFDIIDARTWVSNHGMVIYSYRLSSIYPTRVREEQPWARLRADLLAVSKRELDATVLLEKRRHALVAKPADSGFDDPAIKVEQRTSDHHTIVDVHIKDEVGLLSRLCRSISEYGCEISYACINTMGDIAVDVFYVDRSGTKLDDADAEGLRQHLIASMRLQPQA